MAWAALMLVIGLAAVIWAYGLLHLTRLAAMLRRARPSPDQAESPR